MTRHIYLQKRCEKNIVPIFLPIAQIIAAQIKWLSAENIFLNVLREKRGAAILLLFSIREEKLFICAWEKLIYRDNMLLIRVKTSEICSWFGDSSNSSSVPSLAMSVDEIHRIFEIENCHVCSGLRVTMICCIESSSTAMLDDALLFDLGAKLSSESEPAPPSSLSLPP